MRFGRCKFGTFCSYTHSISKEVKLEEKIKDLKSEMTSLKETLSDLKIEIETMKNKNKNKEATTDTLDNMNENRNEKVEGKNETVEMDDIFGTSLFEIKETKRESKTIKVNKHISFEDVIRENSGIMCHMCDRLFRTRRQLKKHIVQSHTRRESFQAKTGHVYFCDSGRDILCTKCLFKTQEENEIIEHMKEEHAFILGVHFKPSSRNHCGVLLCASFIK